MKTLGVDVGSRYVKLAAFDGGITFTEKVDTISFYRTCRVPTGGVEIGRLEFFGEKELDFGQVVSTGYGRHNVKVNDSTVISEIRAHAHGAAYQTGMQDFTLIDLGGQDTKIARVRGGEVDDFIMNDKCAAGSGRYLENIAHTLGLSMEELARHYENPAPLSDTCAIFGESETIGHVAEGTPIEQICAGANHSVAQRVLALTKRFQSPVYVLTGGVAKNSAVVRFISNQCGGEVIVPDQPLFNGAIGCAMHHAVAACRR